jgi:hypothetical protein
MRRPEMLAASTTACAASLTPDTDADKRKML